MTTDFPHDKAPASPAPVTAVPYLTAASIKAMTDEQLDAALDAVEENQRRLLDEVNASNGGWLGVDDFLDACDHYALGRRVHEDVRAWQCSSTREAYTAFVHALLLLRLPAGMSPLPSDLEPDQVALPFWLKVELESVFFLREDHAYPAFPSHQAVRTMLVREDLLSTNLRDIDFSRLERRVAARLLGRRVEGWPRIPAGPAHPVQRKRAVLRRVMAERREVAAFVAAWPLDDETEDR